MSSSGEAAPVSGTVASHAATLVAALPLESSAPPPAAAYLPEQPPEVPAESAPTPAQQPPRRTSSRRTRGIPSRNHGSLPILNFQRPWTRHYIDIGHCRIQKCTMRIQNAKQRDIETMKISFCSMAIKASTAYGPKAKQERDLIAYVRTVMARGVDPNDQDITTSASTTTESSRYETGGGQDHKHHEYRSAVAAAAYYGYTNLLQVLLDEGKCSSLGGSPHALLAAVSNGQHDCIQLLFQYRSNELIPLLQREAQSQTKVLGTLRKAIAQKDLWSIQYLRDNGRVVVSDFDLIPESLCKSFVDLALKEMYPTTKNLKRWRKELHWTFPATDRRLLNWLYHAVVRDWEQNQHGNRQPQLPPELWLRVFGFVGRFWWAPYAFVDGSFVTKRTTTVRRRHAP